MGRNLEKLQIGGYLALDVQSGPHFHSTECRYNTARSALVALCRALQESSRQPLRLLLPRFNCPDVAEVLQQRTNVEVYTYSIDENLEPILPEGLVAGSILYFVNLFAVKSEFAARLPKGSIVDNVHAFFSPAVTGMHTLYSARKFIGVPDGAYLYSDVDVERPPEYVAWEESTYLLQRLDVGARAAYEGFQSSERALSRSDVRGMSALSRTLLGSLNYERFRQQRRTNFEYLHAQLGQTNELAPLINRALSDENFVPLCYPHLRPEGERVRDFLISEGVFVPRYWANIATDPQATPFEKYLARDGLHLPIDHRYGRAEMEEIVARMKMA